jgi:hypothetical protein
MSAAQVRHAAARRDQPQVVYALGNPGISTTVECDRWSPGPTQMESGI